MIEATQTPQTEPPSPEAELAPEAASPQSAVNIHSGKLYLEVGGDYLIWSLTGRSLFGSKRTYGGAIANSLLRDPLILFDRISEIVEGHGMRHGSVNLYLSLPEAMLRSFYVPVVPKNELTQVVIWEASKVFPFALQGELFDWRIVDTVEWRGARKYQIQAAGSIAFKVQAICEKLSDKGLNVKRITLTSLAWEPLAVSFAGKTASTCVAIVRLLGNRLSVFCFHQGALEFVRENTIELTDSGGDFEASLRFFDGAAPATLFDQQSSRMIDPESISKMVLDNLDYYYGRFTQRTVDSIILAIPPEEHQPIADALHETLGVPVHCAFCDMEAKTPTNLISRSLLAPPSYRKLRMGRQLDLLPIQYRLAVRRRTHFRIALYAASLALTAALIASVFQFVILGGLQSEEDRLQSTLDGITNSVPYREIATQVGEQAQWQAQLSQLRGASTEHSQILRAFSLLTPSDIYLTNIFVQVAQGADGRPINSVSVAGFVKDNGRHLELRLAEFLKIMAGFPGCSKVELSNQNTTVGDEGKRLEFSVALEIGI